MKYCPQCAAVLQQRHMGGAPRAVCEAVDCGFVHWNNPTPVVAAIVEHEGKVILARNAAWPPGIFGLITGFLEAGESAEQGILREVHEELGLTGDVGSLVGVYEFVRRNEIIIAYHVIARGVIQLNEELVEYKAVSPERCKAWPFATGLALRDWLRTRGIEPDMIQFG